MKNYNRGGNKFGGGSDFKRDFRKPEYGGRSDTRDRFAMHQAICSDCGRNCEVPFEPTQGKPVYCNACFSKHRNENPKKFEGRSEERRFNSYSENTNERRTGNSDEQLKRQFETLNWKIDKILKILTPIVAATPLEVTKVEKVEKVKKDFTPIKFKKKKGPNKV